VTNDFIASTAQLACLLEASAPKPGNVSPGKHFRDARYEDFLASAVAIGPAFAADLPLGEMIHAAIRATTQWTRSNTNLGIVLLLAPLARAARTNRSLRNVLADTTVEDAREAYAAIRLARPGGLGTAPEEDVAAEPSVSLTEAMRLAADRDSIASEYVTNYRITFEIGAPVILGAIEHGWEEATVRTYPTLLAEVPDSLIARKQGRSVAERVSRDARRVLGGGLEDRIVFDQALRADELNPGTTADLTAAALYVALLSGLWHPYR
jgi:triphosphoribosyl-dephospho-CoA synthase